MCNHHLKFYFDDATYTTHQQPAQQPARMGARQSLVSIYIAQPNPALRRPVLLLLCGARDMCSCHDAWPSSRPLPQQVNIVRSGGLGRPCFVGQASRPLRSPCLLIISVFFGCFCSFAGRWPARHDSQCPHDVVSFIFHLSITCRHSRTN